MFILVTVLVFVDENMLFILKSLSRFRYHNNSCTYFVKY